MPKNWWENVPGSKPVSQKNDPWWLDQVPVKKEKQPVIDFRKFSTEDLFTAANPYLQLNVPMSQKSEKINVDRQRYDMHDYEGSLVSLVVVPEHEEDAIRVHQHNNLIDIAIADGVSMSELPRVASRAAAIFASRALSTRPPDALFAQHVYGELQKIDFVAMALDKEQKSRDGNDWMAQGQAEQFTRLREKGHVGLTTLLAAKYENKSGRLDSVIVGDSIMLIFRADGSVETHIGAEDLFLQYKPGSGSDNDLMQPANLKKVKLGSTVLSKGDVVIFSSDGISEAKMPGLSTRINDQLRESRQRKQSLHRTVAELLKEEIRNNGVNDDTTAFILER